MASNKEFFSDEQHAIDQILAAEAAVHGIKIPPSLLGMNKLPQDFVEAKILMLMRRICDYHIVLQKLKS